MIDKGVILTGAVASGLPADYIEKLKDIPHNEYVGDYDIQVQDCWLANGWSEGSDVWPQSS